MRRENRAFTGLHGFLAIWSLLGIIGLSVANSSSAWAAISPATLEQVKKTAADLPVYFSVPERAYAELSPAADGMIFKFEHPASLNGSERVGMRLIPMGRDVQSVNQLGKVGLLQTGDVVLTFRPEWKGTGSYPSIQMGVSHSGVIYIDNGQVYNIDNPMNAEYLGQLNASHYQESKALHVIRPRGLTDKQKANLVKWAKALVKRRSEIYPDKLSFNTDYSSPKCVVNLDGTYDQTFVKHVGAMAMGIPTRQEGAYCSELAWAILGLRDCNMEADRAEFESASGTPRCIKPIFIPMPGIGNYFLPDNGDTPKSRKSVAGLTEGPLLILDAMQLPANEEQEIIQSIFTRTADMNNISSGHRKVAEMMAPLFDPLKGYYLGVETDVAKAQQIKQGLNRSTKPNYSPTSFLINSFLPQDNATRSLDYVGTILFAKTR